ELHFRGCDENHPLIRRAGELIPRLKAVAVPAQGEAKKPADDPAKFQAMSPQTVSAMDIEGALAKGDITPKDLVEAAFAFENQLLALHGDDTPLPFDAYENLSHSQLITIIKTATCDICRLYQ
ncbi:MAG: hypothetical protein MI749_09995, partial [Desulfovibrionales bacterium]|nr:hypothetical protein [Desulfovibrionales bacterium]